ncbi:hypothetical protein A946_04000 [Methylacidiphilum kamchatkense Kam1]|uniref:Polyketide cyclase/dehydrase/lipid transport protein n=1 Tax=Methylacidiphilum kamchatkense Kam1 TaxID=1202785 RepID=A0A0C1RKQ1_9BACT|nr:SRPBCC domain-containing protein [Methylacidiphilum kamchatkense]KIE58622.1 hypothetical protein A946_04000 [Methylacidiphilum kamchatkense Kam1]QDQ41996.1 hypothetical protein kam1_751 [Methylacidiphilum kamchatkense Kam1]
MYTISTEIEIKAKKEALWDCLSNFSAYPYWNPFIKKIWFKKLESGQPLRLLIQAPSSFPVLMTGKITTVSFPSLIRWECYLIHPFFLKGIHTLEWTEHRPLSVIFLHHETFDGFLLPILWKMMEKRVRKGFESMNHALKNKLESLS